MSSAVEAFLESNGPCLTSEVADYLIGVHKLAPTAARKRVSRIGAPVKRLAMVTFPRKARFMYLQKDFGSPRFWRALEAALLATNSVYGLALAAIQERGGIIPAAHFPIACGSPLKQARHLSADTVYQRLHEAKLIEKTTVGGLGECVTLVQSPDHFEFLSSNVRARLITESLLLTAVRDWVRRLGIGSYESVITRDGDKLPTVGTFAWDLTAPSFLGPLLKYGKDGNARNGFVACDVLLGTKIDAGGIQPFLHKCQTLRRLRNVGPCMQIFVADSYTREAFSLAKRNGIIPATPLNLFGTDVAEGLAKLTHVLSKAAASIIDPGDFDVLFKKLGKIEGAAIQLRGTLFEFLVADVARKTLSATVRMNRKFKNDQGEAEADVVAVRDNQAIVMIECKGYSPYAQVPDNYLQRWLQHNVPVCYRAIKDHPDWKNLPAHFEFWVTGSLSSEAIAMFETAKATVKPSRYTLDLKFSPQIHEACLETKDVGLIEAFERHYMKATI